MIAFLEFPGSRWYNLKNSCTHVQVCKDHHVALRTHIDRPVEPIGKEGVGMSHAHVGHHHDHTHGMAKRTLRIAFFLTIIILCAGLIGGLFAHSLALLSDAGHTLTDLFALGLAWFAAGQ